MKASTYLWIGLGVAAAGAAAILLMKANTTENPLDDPAAGVADSLTPAEMEAIRTTALQAAATKGTTLTLKQADPAGQIYFQNLKQQILNS